MADENDSKQPPKLILPEGYGPRRLVSLREHFGDGYTRKDVFEFNVGPARAADAIFDDIKTTIQKFRFGGLTPGCVPLAAAADESQNAIDLFRRSMRRYTLVTVEETDGRELAGHLGLMVAQGLIDINRRRRLAGLLLEQFARQAAGPEVIVLGDLGAMTAGDPAHGFLRGAFFNPAVISINGEDKIHVREHLDLLRQGRATPRTAQILTFRPRG
jgi:hypothetical protein